MRSESLSKNPETMLAAFERFSVKSVNLTVFGITALDTFVEGTVGQIENLEDVGAKTGLESSSIEKNFFSHLS